MEKENSLFLEICQREWREIDMIDASPTRFGNMSFRRMNMGETEYYLNYSAETKRLKKDLRKEAGWLKYYFVYTFKFVNNFNAHYYTRP